MARNKLVEAAVHHALRRIDYFIGGEKLLKIPSSNMRGVIDDQLSHKSSSVRLATLFLVYYSLSDEAWDFNTIPTGLRGTWGDKLLTKNLSSKNITLHNAITAFGENLGWKGNVSAARLRSDTRFKAFSELLEELSVKERQAVADYLAMRFAESRRTVSPLPPVSDKILTYTRARVLFYTLISIPSGGSIQQFLVAALLYVHRIRHRHEIRTHHAHASDKYDTTAGDIEELHDGKLVRAYEVTVRPDWKNRINDFRKKMDIAELSKYTIIASNVNNDDNLKKPASMLKFIEPYGRDIAVVDIEDFVNVFAMELSAEELRSSINKTYEYLVSPTLCGRADVIDKFSVAVSHWLDTASS